ncbi:MAG: hypothetical protein JW969_18445 [Spirochaetales bacterium]|nr:hypothetical protein [Spirochaetales bacterium]
MKRTIYFLTAIFLVFIFINMNGAAAEKKAWTYLVYMVADNDLEEDALSDLTEMMSVGSNERVNIVVLCDRSKYYTIDPVGGLKDWTGAKKILVEKGSLKEIAKGGPINMGSPSTLAEFIAWGVKKYPAQRYALDFWDHGGGWVGFGYDESTKNIEGLTLSELKKGVSAGMKNAGLSKFEFMGFDACLMGTYEVVEKLGPYTRYLLASEEMEPGHGWDYSSLKILREKKDTTGVDLGKSLIDGFTEQAKKYKTYEEITLSLIDTSQFPKLMSAIKTLTETGQKNIKKLAPMLGRSVNRSLGFGKAPEPDQDMYMVDVGSLAQTLARNNQLFNPIKDEIVKALDSLVVAKTAGTMKKDSTGLSIYFPEQQRYYDKYYNNAGPQKWRDLMDAYYNAGKTIPKDQIPKFLNKANRGEFIAKQDAVFLNGKVKPELAENVVDSVLFFGIMNGRDTVFLGNLKAEPDTETGVITGEWDLFSLIVIQGGNWAFGYLGESMRGEGLRQYKIPFAYFKDGKVDANKYSYVYLSLLINAKGEIIQKTYYLQTGNNMFGELAPQKGSKIVPLIKVLSDKGGSKFELTTEKGFDPLKEMEFKFKLLQDRKNTTIYLQLIMADYGGNRDWLYYEGPVD